MKRPFVQAATTPTTARSTLLSSLLRAGLLAALWALPGPARGQIFVTQTDSTGRIPGIGEYTTTGAVVNQALISAGSGGPLWPGVALSGTNLFVMEFTGIGKYTTAGATVKASFLPNSSPVGIALSDDGATLFVADSSAIGAYDAVTGAVLNRALITGLAEISGTIISAPTAIAVSGSDLYVVHPGLAVGLGRIGRYTTAGATVNASLITGLTWPQNIAVDGGNLYVTMGRQTGSVGKFTTSGATVNAALAVVNGYPQGIAISDGNLFVVHDYNNQVSEFTLSGDAVHDPLLTGLPGAQGIAVVPVLPPIGSFSYNTGGAPVHTGNAWQFFAGYSALVSDLRLHVQSSLTPDIEGSWTDLPDSSKISDVDGNWTLKTTDVPSGLRFFRVFASAPGYTPSASKAIGPEDVQGIIPFSDLNVQTALPYQPAAAWTFTIAEPLPTPGLSMRLQFSTTPDVESSWTDLPGGAQMSSTDAINWRLETSAVPLGTVSFRVVGSAPTYADEISGVQGPFAILNLLSLPAIGSFSYSTGGTPIRSSNPWKFLASYSTLISGIKLRVQSSSTPGTEGSWGDLPGNPYMGHLGADWSLTKTEVPVGLQSFRVIASAPGYSDRASAPIGPETVLEGFEPWGYFSYATTVPFWTATPWSFGIVQPTLLSDIKVRMQSSATPADQSSWTDLPGGGQMTRLTDLRTWVLYTTNLPTGNISFRAIASAANYVDRISSELGPFDIGKPLPVSITSGTSGGTFSVLAFPSFPNPVNWLFNAVGAIVDLFIPAPSTSTQAAMTLAGQKGGSVQLKLTEGELAKPADLTTPGVNLGKSASLILTGTINGDVNANPLISQDGGGVVSHDGGSVVSNDGGSVVSNDGGSLISQDGGGVVSHDGGSIVSHDGGSLTSILAALIADNGGGIVSQGAGNIVSQGAGNVIGVNGSADEPGVVWPNTATLGLAHSQEGLMSANPAQPAFTGLMTINGNYSQYRGAALLIAIAGTNTASTGGQQYDQLVVSGQANFFAGHIAFGFFNPQDQTNRSGVFQPADGATFDVVVASNIVAQALFVRGPIWGDGQFFNWGVVTRPDGLQALRLVATHVPPLMTIQRAGTALELLYPTNYTGYSVQTSPTLAPPAWTPLPTSTNLMIIRSTNSSRFFRLSKP